METKKIKLTALQAEEMQHKTGTWIDTIKQDPSSDENWTVPELDGLLKKINQGSNTFLIKEVKFLLEEAQNAYDIACSNAFGSMPDISYMGRVKSFGNLIEKLK